ncbi:MAG: futalosine hydrolase [Planctomycetes bacterium]|nr:futalosine hydrolase [Planctomycetota bacterium]MCB9910098.1 futalosine hydrolase [Planctomycetota bacterium]MCB9913355.1 futalosine hydrolase [Planctomycetota bacterium]
MDHAARIPSSPKTLVLVPTELERRHLEGPGAPPFELCGFGPIAAAASTARKIALDPPNRVLLLGIAGTYDPERFPVGSAAQFGELGIWGLGAGSGAEALGPGAMGLDQWPGDPQTSPVRDRLRIGDLAGLLITVCAASAGPSDTASIRRTYPEALGEDMEAFGVAMACHLAGVPFACLRGASNLAGDREHSRWRIGEALKAVRRLAQERFPELWCDA